MKVLWLCNYPSPYAMKHFSKLAESLELTALMFDDKEEHRNSEWKISDNLNFKVIVIDKSFNSIIDNLAKENDIFIDSLYTSIYAFKLINKFKKYNKKVIMQADGGVVIDRGPLFNKVISLAMKRHDLFLSSGPHCDYYFNFYGVKNENIKHYRFSSLTNNDIQINKEMISNKKKYRDELNIDDKFTLISVGRPIKLKGFDTLIKSYIKTGLTDDINLYIVGGQPQEEIKELVDSNNLNNVHFIELLNSEELKKYYVSSDAFILCTRTDVWGLVILEALSFGLPVITSNNCGAGVHFNLLSECVVTCDIEDIEGYSNKIKELYNNRNRTLSLGKEALNVVNEYTIENSAQDIINILNTI